MSLFSSMQVSASGMEAQRTRAELLVQNIANSETTQDSGRRAVQAAGCGFFDQRARLAVLRGISKRIGNRREGRRRDPGSERPGDAVLAGASGRGRQRVRRVSEDQSGGGHGRSAEFHAVLRSQRGGDLVGERYDQPVHRHHEVIEHDSADSSYKLIDSADFAAVDDAGAARGRRRVSIDLRRCGVESGELPAKRETPPSTGFCPAKARNCITWRWRRSRPTCRSSCSCRSATRLWRRISK